MRISDWSSDVCSSDLDESPDWRNWLQAAGVSGIDVQRGPGFSDSSMVVEAAAAGQGVALGHRWLAAADLESGRIVMPFGPVLPSKFAYYLVSPEALAERRRVRLFREWLLEEAEGAGAKRVDRKSTRLNSSH